MSKRQKTIEKILNGTKLTFDEIHNLLLSLGYVHRVNGSHYIYRKDADHYIVLPRHGKHLRPVYNQKLKELLKDEL